MRNALENYLNLTKSDAREEYYNACVELMDDDLREEIHSNSAPCYQSEFLKVYSARHLEKFGEEFYC